MQDMDDLDEIEEDIEEDNSERDHDENGHGGAASAPEEAGTSGDGTVTLSRAHAPSSPPGDHSPPSPSASNRVATPAHSSAGGWGHGNLLRWSDEDRKAALIQDEDGGKMGSADAKPLPTLSLKVPGWADEVASPLSSAPGSSPARSVSPPPSGILRPSAPSPPPTPPSPALFQKAVGAGDRSAASLQHSPKLSAWGDETGPLVAQGETLSPPHGEADTADFPGGLAHSSPNASPGKASPSPTSSRSASAGSVGGRKSSSPPSPHVMGYSFGEVVTEVSEALLADVVAEAMSDLSMPRSAGNPQQRAHAMQHASLSPRAASAAAVSSKAGSVGRRRPERLRIERSPSPPGRSMAHRGLDSRSPSASPSPSPSRRRGVSCAVAEFAPDNRTPSPRSPRSMEAETLSATGGASAGLDVLSAARPDTPSGAAEGLSDAASAVMFVHEVLEGVDDAMLANLEALRVHEHFLSLAKSRKDLPEHQHIYHKLVFDLINEELEGLRAEETRRRRGPSFRLGTDSLYGAPAAAPRMDPEAVRKEVLLRVARLCALGEPTARSLLPQVPFPLPLDSRSSVAAACKHSSRRRGGQG